MEGTRTASRETSYQSQHRAWGIATALRSVRHTGCRLRLIVWHDPLRDKTHLRHLRTVQRAAFIRVLSPFRTVATTTLDVESHVLPTHLRLCCRAHTSITRLLTLPQKHPIWSALPGPREDATLVDRSLGSRYQKP